MREVDRGDFEELFYRPCVVCVLSCQVTSDSVTPRTAIRQAPLSMEFSRQEHWSGLLFPPSGDLPESGIEPESLTSPALTGRFFTTSATWKAHQQLISILMCKDLGSHHTHLCNKKNLDKLKSQ